MSRRHELGQLAEARRWPAKMKLAAMIKRVGWVEWQKLPMEAKQPWIDLCCSEAALPREAL
eukprot:8154918-Prorocentrum_lima.AAC.1